MLQKSVFILVPVIIIIALYSLITSNYEWQPVMMLLLSLLMLPLAVQFLRKDSKLLGWSLIAVFLFTLFVSIQGFLLN